MKNQDPKVEEIGQGIIGYFKSTKRENYLPLVVKRLQKIAQKKTKEKTAYVISAITLDDKKIEKITSFLKEITDEKIKVKNIIEKDVLGGFKIRLGDYCLDATLRNELTLLKQNIW